MSVTVFNTISKANNVAQDDFTVAVTLSWDTTLSPVATAEGYEAMLSGQITASTNRSGYWELNLIPNDEIDPEGSLYKIVETDGTSTNEYFVSVTTDATPVDVWVGDILVPKPSWED